MINIDIGTVIEWNPATGFAVAKADKGERTFHVTSFIGKPRTDFPKEGDIVEILTNEDGGLVAVRRK